MAVMAYARVSTDRQAEGDSLDVQRRTIAGYAHMLGLAVTETFAEAGVSASVPLHQRPLGNLMLSKVGRGDLIITTKLDRLFRSALDALTVLEEMRQRGVAIHMIDLGGDPMNNPVSKLVFTILSGVAEAERARIRERIAAMKADQKARGLYLGGLVPFGFEVVEDRLRAMPDREARVQRVRAMRAAGATLRAIQAAVGISKHTIVKLCVAG